MADLFKTLTGGLWQFVYAWMLPTAFTVVSFCLLAWPESLLEPLAEGSNESAAAVLTRGLLVALVVLALTLLLALNSSLLYRVLEGRTWPTNRLQGLRDHQLKRKSDLETGIEHEPDATRRRAARERLKLFPEQEDDVLPTRLGNAVRAVESYGHRRYRIDHNTLWYELRVVVDEPVRKEVSDAESIIDFFVGFVFLSASFSLAALVNGVLQQDLRSIAIAPLAAVLAYVFYDRAVQSTRQWRLAVQAMVNIGRLKLADAYGLTIPATLQDERRMWRALSAFVYWGDQTVKHGPTLQPELYRPGRYGTVLDGYRKVTPPSQDEPRQEDVQLGAAANALLGWLAQRARPSPPAAQPGNRDVKG